MTFRRRPRSSDGGYAEGFSLIEVVTALAIVSITVVPLLGIFLSAREKADHLGQELAAEAAPLAGHQDTPIAGRPGSPWSWSPASIENAWWQEDCLRIRIRVPAQTQQLAVGWWVDGWFGGKKVVDVGAGALVTMYELRRPPSQKDVVLRVREGEGSWGVPWMVGTGEPTDPQAQDGVEESGASQVQGVATIVLHGPGAGLSRIKVIPAIPCDSDELSDWPAVATLSGGKVVVESDGRTQALQARPGAYLHLYF